MKVYVVIGSTGEYDDSRSWIVKAFNSRNKASEFVIEADKIAVDAFAECGFEPIEEKYLKLDPKMDLDYTGTFYSFEGVELVD